MSASDKKKLRKELNAAATTEKQLAAKKEQKKARTYTLVFAIVMVLVVALVLVSVLQTPVKVMMANNTTAATVNEHKISATEFNYFYYSVISNFYSQFSSAGDYQDLYVQIYTGLNPTTGLDDQIYDQNTGKTWADYFIDSTLSNIQWTYTMYDAAVKEGYQLSEDEQKSIDSMGTYLELYATLYGYTNVDSYLRASYGTTASLETYMNYYEISALASSYASNYYSSLAYTDEQIREYEKDKMNEYNSYTWSYYYLDAKTFLEGGTEVTGDDGKTSITYSDEETAASVKAALENAEAIIGKIIESYDDFNSAINTVLKEYDASHTDVTATKYENVLYSSLSATDAMIEWLTDDARVAGDLTCIANTTTDSDNNETINGYYILYFSGCIDNSDVNVGTVRHLLVAFEEDDDGNVTDEAKAAAKEEAEKLLAQYLAGELTEEAFTALIKENSDDTEDGLYSDVTPDSGYVTAFSEWATADHEVGDVEIVETEYGYHIMYYVSCADMNYRDTMIHADLVEENYTEWEEALIETSSAELGNTKYVDRDLIVSNF